jgi:hypothetical protein
MAATLDGIVEGTEAVFEAKFICRRHSPKILPPKSIWLRSSTTCGSHT